MTPGNVIFTPPDEVHWHGAAPEHFMVHLSITEGVDEGMVETDWLELVTDEEYRR